MFVKTGMTDVAELMAGTEADLAQILTAATTDGTEELKADWRDEIVRVGLGSRLANTIRGKTYPAAGVSLDPATWVWTKAPKIIDAYSTGVTIVPGKGRFLCIPTLDVPRKRTGDALSPSEVEARFGRKLQFISPSDRGFWTPSITHGGTAFLVLKNLVVRRATGRFRNATPRELKRGRAGERALSSVVMFILVPQVKVPKRIDLDAIADRATSRWPSLLDRRWSSLPNRAARMKGL